MTRFLDWFERHKFGVVGTLMLHTFLMFAFAMSKLKTPETKVIVPELELVMEAPPPDVTPEEQRQKLLSAQDVTNQASNSTADPGVRSLSRAAQERMATNVEADLHAMEQAEFERLAEERKASGKEVVIPKLDPSKFDKNNYMDKTTKPVKVEGLTTVSYDLVGRTDIVLEVPAYLCKGQGRVVVRVAVDRSGEVSKAELDPKATTTTDDCMVSNAMASASGARFSGSSTAAQPQRGTITYVFLAQ